jgi:type II secretion system (T2SS) protein M
VSERVTGWWPRLGPRDRRALALGAALLGAGLAVRVAVMPSIRLAGEMRDQIARERDLLGRERALLAEVKAYPARMPGTERALLDEAPRLFGGADLSTAPATLVNYLSTRALEHRVFVQQSASRPPSAVASGVTRLQVDFRAVGDLEGMLALLRELESGPKLLTVERLTIGQAERLNVGGTPRDEEVLGLSATVSGYALGDLEQGQDTLAVVAQGAGP